MMQSQMKTFEREIDRLKDKLASTAGNDLASQAVPLPGGAKLLVGELPGVDPKSLRGMVDNLKDRLKPAVVFLTTVSDGKISLVAGVTSDLTGKVKAGDLVGMVAGLVGGKGGGRPDMAMGGGTDVAALPAAASQVQEWVRQRLE